MNRRCLYQPFHRERDGTVSLDRRRMARCQNRATVRLHGPSTGTRIKVCQEHADLYLANRWKRGWPSATPLQSAP